jgi:phage shock protein PspC (stress-responsive transcriptional regulator)
VFRVGALRSYRLEEERAVAQTLVRPRRGSVIAGVCAGIARRFGLSATTVRLAFIISCVLPGPQVVIYILLWVLMPKEG